MSKHVFSLKGLLIKDFFIQNKLNFFCEGKGTYIKSWQSTSPKYTWKKYVVKNTKKFYPDSSIIFFPNVFPRMSKPKCSPHTESNDQPQNIGHIARSNASELVQNTSKSLKNIGGCIVGYSIECRFITFKFWFSLAITDDEIDDP